MIQRIKKGCFLFIIFLAPFFSNNVFSQADTTLKRMIYSIGYSHSRTLDLQNSPLIYRANLLGLSVVYEKWKPQKSLFNTSLDVYGGITRPKGLGKREVHNNYFDKNGDYHHEIVRLIHPEFQLQFSVDYLRRVNKLSSVFADLYIGAQIHEFFYINYLASWGFDMPSVLNAFTLKPKIMVDYKLKHLERGFISLSFPIVGLITRLPYSNVPSIDKHGPFIATFESGTNFNTLNKYQHVDFEAGIEKELNEKWNMLFSYHFSWFHSSKVFSIKSYNNNVKISFVRKIKSKR